MVRRTGKNKQGQAWESSYSDGFPWQAVSKEAVPAEVPSLEVLLPSEIVTLLSPLSPSHFSQRGLFKNETP